MFHIIDDTKFVCELMADIMKLKGYEALTFTCPEAYVQYLSSEHFQKPLGVFVDINMPLMSGYDMMDIALLLRPNLKFSIMTSEEKIRAHYMENMNMYLHKPFRIKDVTEVVEAFIENQSLVQEEGSWNDARHCA